MFLLLKERASHLAFCATVKKYETIKIVVYKNLKLKTVNKRTQANIKIFVTKYRLK